MKKDISIRELKKDIKAGYYELYDGDYFNYSVVLLNENDYIYINMLDMKNELQGFSRIEKKELLQMNKKEFHCWINSVIYYCVNEPLEFES